METSPSKMLISLLIMFGLFTSGCNTHPTDVEKVVTTQTGSIAGQAILIFNMKIKLMRSKLIRHFMLKSKTKQTYVIHFPRTLV